MSENKECSICYEEIGATNCCTTSCGHQFCFKCIATAIQYKNTCPCCRTSLVEVPEDTTDYEDDNDNENMDEEEDETEDEEEEAEVEDIVKRLEQKGVTMLEVVSLLIGRYSKNLENNTEQEPTAILHNRIWDVIVEADDEVLEQNNMMNEEIKSMVYELANPRTQLVK